MSVSKLDFNVVRQAKKSFTGILNDVIQNIPDAFTLGLFVYLSSLPPEWNVNATHLMAHFNVGRDKLARSMAWMSEHCLITYVQERNQDGSFGKSTIVVEEGWTFIENYHNKQQQDTAPLKIRGTDNPDNGESAPINNTIIKKEIEFKKETKSSCDVRPKKPKAEKPKTRKDHNNEEKHHWAANAKVCEPVTKDPVVCGGCRRHEQYCECGGQQRIAPDVYKMFSQMALAKLGRLPKHQ